VVIRIKIIQYMKIKRQGKNHEKYLGLAAPTNPSIDENPDVG
jgi:hypothetical protein